MKAMLDRKSPFGEDFQLNFLVNAIKQLGAYKFHFVDMKTIKQSRELIDGKVYKAIENVKLFHTRGVNKRQLLLDLGRQPQLKCKQPRDADEIEREPKVFKLHTITKVDNYGCATDIKDLLEERLEERRERSRSKSVL